MWKNNAVNVNVTVKNKLTPNNWPAVLMQLLSVIMWSEVVTTATLLMLPIEKIHSITGK